jgi:hypothetical protein
MTDPVDTMRQTAVRESDGLIARLPHALRMSVRSALIEAYFLGQVEACRTGPGPMPANPYRPLVRPGE